MKSDSVHLKSTLFISKCLYFYPSAFSRRAVVSYWRKYVHEVLVNRLGGLSLPRKSVVRLTDRPDMTLDVYRGRKKQCHNNNNNCISKLFHDLTRLPPLQTCMSPRDSAAGIHGCTSWHQICPLDFSFSSSAEHKILPAYKHFL